MRESTLGVNGNADPNMFDLTRPPLDQRPMGENLLITCRRKVQGNGVVNSCNRGCAWPQSDPSGGDETINRLTHKFSPGGQGTLYPVKLFGIIELVRALPRLSTAACPLYDECGDMIAQSY